MSRPTLLFVSPRFIFPANEGGKIRTGHILRQMKGRAFDLTLASPAPANLPSFRADLNAVCDRFLSWPAVGPSSLRRLGALAARLPVSVETDRSAAGRGCIRMALAKRPHVVV